MIIIPKIPYINKLTEEQYKRITAKILNLNSNYDSDIKELTKEQKEALDTFINRNKKVTNC